MVEALSLRDAKQSNIADLRKRSDDAKYIRSNAHLRMRYRRTGVVIHIRTMRAGVQGCLVSHSLLCQTSCDGGRTCLDCTGLQ